MITITVKHPAVTIFPDTSGFAGKYPVRPKEPSETQ